MEDEKKMAPMHLTHKPIYAINDYDKVDGYYKNHTDVYALSIGKAQWDSDQVIPSVKVWRKVGPENKQRWSRQSEETTLTRAIDMATLIIKVLDKHYNGKAFAPVNSIYGNLEIEKMNADPSIVKEFNDFLEKNKVDINEHIKLLNNALTSYYEK